MTNNDVELGIHPTSSNDVRSIDVREEAERIVTDPAIVIDLTHLDDIFSISWPIVSVLALYFMIQNAIEIVLIAGNVLLLNNFQAISLEWKNENRSGTLLALFSIMYSIMLIVYASSQTELGPIFARICWRATPVRMITPIALILTVTFVDVMSRFILEAIDLLVRIWSGSPSRRARIMSVLVGIANFYRELVPVRVWLDIFEDGAGTGPALGSVLRLAYLFAKWPGLMGTISTLYQAIMMIRKKSPLYGKYMSDNDHHCPICQESVCCPIQLPCSHIFCEQCLLTWSERQRSCPMCRAILSSKLNPQLHAGNGYYRFGPLCLF